MTALFLRERRAPQGVVQSELSTRADLSAYAGKLRKSTKGARSCRKMGPPAKAVRRGPDRRADDPNHRRVVVTGSRNCQIHIDPPQRRAPDHTIHRLSPRGLGGAVATRQPGTRTIRCSTTRYSRFCLSAKMLANSLGETSARIPAARFTPSDRELVAFHRRTARKIAPSPPEDERQSACSAAWSRPWPKSMATIHGDCPLEELSNSSPRPLTRPIFRSANDHQKKKKKKTAACLHATPKAHAIIYHVGRVQNQTGDRAV